MADYYGGANPNYGTNPNDASSMGFAVLSFFFPVIGLILFLVWKKDTPLKAKSCGKGALIGVIVEVALSCILTIVTILLAGSLY